MINIIIKAGLCNQLFMIFAGISYAIDNNMDFSILVQKVSNNYFDNFLLNLRKYIIYKIDDTFVNYKETNYHYDPIPVNKNINIEGFFQSCKYFEKNYEKIINMIDIPNKKIEIYNKYSHLFVRPNVAIHFRIGDYYGLQYYHPILSFYYYLNSLNFIEKKLNNKNFNIYLFYQKCDKNLIELYQRKLIECGYHNSFMINDDIEDYNQLILMSLCDNMIIANSTFSWFGAYLSTSENKIVCYPSVWFGEGHKNNNTKDLFPTGWHQIQA